MIREGKGGDTLGIASPRKGGNKRRLLGRFIRRLTVSLPGFVRMSKERGTRALLEVVKINSRLTMLRRGRGRLCGGQLTVNRVTSRGGGCTGRRPCCPRTPGRLMSPSRLVERRRRVLTGGKRGREGQRHLRRLRRRCRGVGRRVRSLLGGRARIESSLGVTQVGTRSLRSESARRLRGDVAGVRRVGQGIETGVSGSGTRRSTRLCSGRCTRLARRVGRIEKRGASLLRGTRLPLPRLSMGRKRLVCGKRR